MIRKLLYLFAIPAIGYVALIGYWHQQIGHSVDRVIDAFDQVADIRYERVTSTLSGKIGIQNLQIQWHGVDETASIAELAILFPGLDYLWNLSDKVSVQQWPESLAITVSDIGVSTRGPIMEYLQTRWVEDDRSASCLQRMSQQPQAFAELGYKTTALSGSLGYTFDADAKTLALKGRVSQADALSVSYNQVIALNDLNIKQTHAALSTLQLQQADWQLTDAGYLDRLYARCEELDQVPRESVTHWLMASYGLGLDVAQPSPFVARTPGFQHVTSVVAKAR